MEYHVRETDKTVRVTEYHGYFITQGVCRDILILICLNIIRLGYTRTHDTWLYVPYIWISWAEWYMWCCAFGISRNHDTRLHAAYTGIYFFKIYRDVTYLGYYGPTIHRYFCCIWGYPENNFHRTGNKWRTMIHVLDKMKHIVENALEVILSKQQIFLNARDYAIEAHKCDFLSLMVINGLRNIPTKANTSQGCAK